MARLPDRFDLWVRRAKGRAEPERQLDYVLGAMVTLDEWFFLNIGTQSEPTPAISEIEGSRYLLVLTGADRVAEIVEKIGINEAEAPVIAIPAPQALAWCVDERPLQSEGLFVNPGPDAVAISLEHAAAFARDWKQRDAQKASGYWIPNLNSEEEEFWQSHGL